MKLALIGTGQFAARHARAFARLGGEAPRLVAASRSAERAEAFAREHGLADACHPYEAAFADASIDGVVIATPHDTHAPLATAALRARKHVLLEKPVTRTIEEARPLAEALGKDAAPSLMVAENYRYQAGLVAACEAIEAGRLGRVHSLLACSVGLHTFRGWRTRREPMGGGALIDGGIHLIHGLRMLAGEVAEVHALEPAEKWNQIEGEASTHALMRLHSGAVASLFFSRDRHGNLPGFDYLVLGTEGSLEVHLRGSHNILHRPEGGAPELLPLSITVETDPLEAMGHVEVARRFLRCMRGEAHPWPDLAEGLRDLAVVGAAYRSVASGRPEPVGDLPPWVAGGRA